MMTSRAEYRLLLRQDNADLRLTHYGYEIGLIDEKRMNYVKYKEKAINEEIERLNNTFVGTSQNVQELLERRNSTLLTNGVTLADLVRRPELSYDDIEPIDKDRPELSEDIREQVNINIKYAGYIERQRRQVEHFKKLENKKIPSDIDYKAISGLRSEAVQKLDKFRPLNVGQAQRISGVSPADISVLLVYMDSVKSVKNQPDA